MIVNKDYDAIVTDGLVLNLDSDFLLSYPATGSVWNDLSILGKTYSVGTNQTYNSSGYFDMTGNTSLQGINCTNLTLTNNSCTLIFWIKTTDTQSLFWGAGGGGAYYVGAYSVSNKEYYSNAGSPDYFQDLIEKITFTIICWMVGGICVNSKM
jgi:hypothetical protein